MYIGGSSHKNADGMSCREYIDTKDEAQDENILDIIPKCGTTTVHCCKTDIKRDTRQHCMVPNRHQQSNICTTEFVDFGGPQTRTASR